MTRIAIFNFDRYSTNELEKLGRSASLNSSFDSKNENRKKSYWASRHLAVLLLHHISKEGLVSCDSSLGFPILVDQNGLIDSSCYISISHTETTVAVAVSAQPIGIDIENNTRNAENVVQKILSEKEKNTYPLLEENTKIQNILVQKPLLFWVLKESAAKASGLGMTKGLDVFEIGKQAKGSFEVTLPTDTPHQLTQPKCTPFIVDGYLLSVCTDGALFGSNFLSGCLFRLLDLNGKFEQLDGFKNS